ncbi:MAG: B12-binding domain-containing radical SAM protein, partial [Deltaproteobacteria bacterium]|nr:B12-binding domain-containing radical SAM protein [Deltaproteobacteria bacterium]
MDRTSLDSILARVSKPSRYLGNEVNVIRKDFDKAAVRVALVFPDKYEIGMSHVGLKILYEILNRLPDVVAERCFAPDLDMEAALRKEGFPLFSLESKRPLKDFDLIGFSLTYELTYINMLAILDLAGIPLWQKDRKEGDPLILAGGGCTMNAEPVADFLDAAVIGDGEEVILEIVEALRQGKIPPRPPFSKGGDPFPEELNFPPLKKGGRGDFLERLAGIEGVYVPSFFNPEYNSDGTLKRMIPLKPGYEKIKKRIVSNIDTAVYP